MEQKYTGKGYLKGPLKGLWQQISVLNDENINKYFKILEFNVNELDELISAFREQLKEGCMLLLEGKVMWANQAASDITGYNRDTLTGMEMVALTVPDMRDKMRARMKMLLAGGDIVFPEEWPFLRYDRTLIYINIFAYRVKFLNMQAILVFFYDITADKKVAEERKMQAEMMDALNDSVFLLDLSGKILYVNEKFCSVLKYTKSEISSMNIMDVTAPELRGKFAIRTRQFSEHSEARFSTVALARDGTHIEVEVRGRVINQGGRQRLLGVARTKETGDETDIEQLLSP